MPTLNEVIRELDPLVRECISEILIYDGEAVYPASLLIACGVWPGDVADPAFKGRTSSELVVHTERGPLTSESLEWYTLALEVRRITDLDRHPSPHDQLRDLRRSRLCGIVRWRKDHAFSHDIFWGATTHNGSFTERREWLVGLERLLGCQTRERY
jgi:hypothetical protein